MSIRTKIDLDWSKNSQMKLKSLLKVYLKMLNHVIKATHCAMPLFFGKQERHCTDIVYGFHLSICWCEPIQKMSSDSGRKGAARASWRSFHMFRVCFFFRALLALPTLLIAVLSQQHLLCLIVDSHQRNCDCRVILITAQLHQAFPCFDS